MRVLLLALAMTLVSTSVWAQGSSHAGTDYSENGYNFGINLEPIYLAVGGIGAKFDFALTRATALSVQGVYAHKNDLSSGDYDNEAKDHSVHYNWTYSEINIGPTFMLTGDLSTRGLYLFPSVGYMKSEVSDFGSDSLSGQLSSPQLRTTIGYQWRFGGLRLAVGGGLRVISSSDIVIKDGRGQEVYREKSTVLGGLALDGQVGWVF
jgi:hypothetical protein